MLDKLLLIILKANKSFIGEIYDAFSILRHFLDLFPTRKLRRLLKFVWVRKIQLYMVGLIGKD